MKIEHKQMSNLNPSSLPKGKLCFITGGIAKEQSPCLQCGDPCLWGLGTIKVR